VDARRPQSNLLRAKAHKNTRVLREASASSALILLITPLFRRGVGRGCRVFGLDHGHTNHDRADEHDGDRRRANERNGERLDGLALRGRHGAIGYRRSTGNTSVKRLARP
jgi:hypothetical protein